MNADANLLFAFIISALASLEDIGTSPPSNPSSPHLTKSVPAAVEHRLSEAPSKDGGHQGQQ